MKLVKLWAFVTLAKDLILNLDLKAKRVGESTIWNLIVKIIALGRREAYEISNILLLELKKDIKEREETLSFLLYFLLNSRVKVL